MRKYLCTYFLFLVFISDYLTAYVLAEDIGDTHVDIDEEFDESLTLKLPVFWQVTRSKSADAGTSILTESYRESWELKANDSGAMSLKSRRAEVSVSGISDVVHSNIQLPSSILINEVDLIALLGIVSLEQEPTSKEPKRSLQNMGRVLTIDLAKSNQREEDLTLHISSEHISSEEYIEVRIDVGGG